MQIIFNYLLIIIILLGASLLGMKYLREYHFYIKKLLHVSAILICADATMKLSTWPLFYIVLFVFLVLFIAINRGFLSDPESGLKETGVVYFAGVYLVMLGVVIYLNDLSALKIVSYSLTILAISDGFAGIFGRWWSQHAALKPARFGQIGNKFSVDNPKSFVGFFVFAGSSYFIIQNYILRFTQFIGEEAIYLALILATLLAILEFVSLKGSDNLTVTVFAFFSFRWMEKSSFESLLLLDISSVSILYWTAIIVGLLLISVGFLTVTGALMSMFLAFVVVVLAKQSLIPLLVFLILGSLVGKLPLKEIISDDRFNKPRNAKQVFANGGIIMIIGLVYWMLPMLGYSILSEVVAGKLMLVSVAICLSDTLSSELGSRFGGVPRDIFSLKKIKPGVSGGVSLVGSFFGLLGSFMVIAVGANLMKISFLEFGLFGLLGFLGMLLDSILGSKFQCKEFRDGFWVDSRGRQIGKEFRGISWISNNAVNFLSNALIIIFLYLIL